MKFVAQVGVVVHLVGGLEDRLAPVGLEGVGLADVRQSSELCDFER